MDILAAYHYFKRKCFGKKGEVSREKYFDILKDITGREDLKNSAMFSYAQEGRQDGAHAQNP